ncbi:MAG: hypothetical protein M1167_03810 [Chloroflexi bacterium]|nr:hypothetical protein [Chloroflexota bacterium]
MSRKTKLETVASALLAVLLVTAALNVALASTGNLALTLDKKSSPSTYVGVTFGGNTTAQAKLLIDRVKPYTNLFVLQSGPISKNETAMTEISQYAIDAGLNLIVYFGYLDPQSPWQLAWLNMARQQWGNKLLGVYLDDEPSGVPLDYNWTGYFTSQKQQNSTVYQEHAFAIDGILNGTYPTNYDEAAKLSQDAIERNLAPLKNSSFTVFTSDYVLYWFDYIGGYDVLLTQLGWNESITQNIDLIRGAANLQGKDWGAIITWKYTQPPYLDTGQEIYNQMLTAYEAGAKYVIIFNYPQIEGNPYGTLQNEHFAALEKFWNTITTSKTGSLPDFSHAEAALVLPKNYAWGMRQPDDKIWGYWGPDENSAKIWSISQSLLSEYGLRLDIVYEDPTFPVAGKYLEIYYWNQTSLYSLQNSQAVLGFQNPSTVMSLGCPSMMN